MSNDRYDDQGNQDLDENFENDYADEFDDTTSSVEDEWEDSDVEDAADSYTPPPKKKKSLSNLFIIGGAVIAGLIFIVFKFGGGASPETAIETPPIESVAETASPMPVDTVQTVAESVAPAPQETTLDPVAQDQTAPPLSDGNVSSSSPDTNVGPLTPMPVETPVENADAAVAPLPAGVQAPSGEVSSAPPLMTAVPDVAAPDAAVPTPSSSLGQEETPPLMAQAEQNSEPANDVSQPLQPVSDFPSADMIKKVDGDKAVPAEQSQGEVVAETSSQPVSVEEKLPDSSSELGAALEKIKQLEDSSEKNSQLIEEYKDQISSLKQEIDALKLRQEEVPVKVERVKKSVRHPIEQTRSGESVPVKWILKGAQSGRALLASGNGTQSDVRTVSVGDKVSGLGTILSIEKGQSGWVVLGTLGRVSQ